MSSQRGEVTQDRVVGAQCERMDLSDAYFTAYRGVTPTAESIGAAFTPQHVIEFACRSARFTPYVCPAAGELSDGSGTGRAPISPIAAPAELFQ